MVSFKIEHFPQNAWKASKSSKQAITNYLFQLDADNFDSLTLCLKSSSYALSPLGSNTYREVEILAHSRI